MRLAVLFAFLLGACGMSQEPTPADHEGPGGKADDSATCEDDEYGDGECQLSLSCGAPDIDCFATHEDDAAARQWFTTEWVEQLVDTADAGAVLPASHSAVKRARRLSDRVWERFPAAVRVGALAEKHLAVIVIDNAGENAFATSMGEKSSLSIQFLRGLLESELSDEAIEGVIAHELGHVVGLHVFPEAGEAITTYYVAAQGEPIGAFEDNVPQVQHLVETWIEEASRVGGDRQSSLASIPIDGEAVGYILALAQSVIDEGGDCSAQAEQLEAAHDAAHANKKLDGSFDLTGGQYLGAYSQFKSCYGTTRKWGTFSDEYETDEIAAFVGDHGDSLRGLSIFNAVEVVTASGREAMDTTEAAFATRYDVPWSRARWYTTEEAADDVAVEYTREASALSPGTSAAMTSFLGELSEDCDNARASGLPPYGVNLERPHHSMCWRVDHAYRYDQYGASRAKKRGAPVWREAFRPTQPVSRKPLH